MTEEDGKHPKILVIGAGRFGQHHIRNLVEIIGPENVFVSEKQEEHGLAICEKFGIDSSNFNTDFKSLLEKVDAVDIVTSTQSHFGIAIYCLNAEKHLFIEKPMTETSKQVAEVIKLAEVKDKIVQPGHIFRFNPAVEYIKKQIDAGNLGNLRIIEGHFCGFKRPRIDIGVAWTDGIHYYDLARYWFGEKAQTVQAVTREFLPRGGDQGLGDKGLEDWGSVYLGFSEGRIAHIRTGYYKPGKHRDLIIVGNRGTIVTDVVKQSVEIFKQRHHWEGDKWTAVQTGIITPEIITQEPLKLQLKAFINSIRTGEFPIASTQAAYELACVVEAIYKSAREKREVKIDYSL